MVMSIASNSLTIGVDIGGTNMRAAVVDAQGQILDRAATLTPNSEGVLVDKLVALVDTLRDRHEISAVGLAVAGFLDPECTKVRFAPHLPWREAPVRDIMTQRLGIPVRLEHDANSAAWGEYVFGQAQETETWVYFSVGTGIGATIMHQGEIFRGSFGMAPEFGHVTVVPGGRKCSCGKRGCLERYASGTALADTVLELADECPEYRRSSLLHTASTGEEIMAAARKGDPLGQAVVAEFARWLGIGLSFVADVIDPELIVLGGGVVGNHDLFLPRAHEVMGESMVAATHRPHPQVSIAKLGSAAGIVGVAHLSRYAEESAKTS